MTAYRRFRSPRQPASPAAPDAPSQYPPVRTGRPPQKRVKQQIHQQLQSRLSDLLVIQGKAIVQCGNAHLQNLAAAGFVGGDTDGRAVELVQLQVQRTHIRIGLALTADR